MQGQFEGKVAVVTGSTQGLGAATARLLAERGAAGLVICGRNEERGRAVAEELGPLCPTHFVDADLAHVADCRAVIRTADQEFGRVDVLVNSAAKTDRGTILDTQPELFDAIFATNVRAPFFLMQEAIAIMIREKIAGTIVNVLSMSSHGGQPFITAYCASKGALATLTRNVAFSVLRNGIRVNGLNIGWMDTPGEATVQKTYHDAPDDWVAEAEAKLPAGRLLKPQEVARAIAFLAGRESGMMTGSLVDFDQQVLGAQESGVFPERPMALPA
jgi:NAD(P)-dependent dehydrogenase (short-subunit alcohol dehydrogenase family)